MATIGVGAAGEEGEQFCLIGARSVAPHIPGVVFELTQK